VATKTREAEKAFVRYVAEIPSSIVRRVDLLTEVEAFEHTLVEVFRLGTAVSIALERRVTYGRKRIAHVRFEGQEWRIETRAAPHRILLTLIE
jgi:hypothetical protein